MEEIDPTEMPIPWGAFSSTGVVSWGRSLVPQESRQPKLSLMIAGTEGSGIDESMQIPLGIEQVFPIWGQASF